MVSRVTSPSVATQPRWRCRALMVIFLALEGVDAGVVAPGLGQQIGTRLHAGQGATLLGDMDFQFAGIQSGAMPAGAVETVVGDERGVGVQRHALAVHLDVEMNPPGTGEGAPEGQQPADDAAARLAHGFAGQRHLTEEADAGHTVKGTPIQRRDIDPHGLRRAQGDERGGKVARQADVIGEHVHGAERQNAESGLGPAEDRGGEADGAISRADHQCVVPALRCATDRLDHVFTLENLDFELFARFPQGGFDLGAHAVAAEIGDGACLGVENHEGAFHVHAPRCGRIAVEICCPG